MSEQDMRVTATDQMTDLQWGRAIIIHLTGRVEDPTPMLLKMIADIRVSKPLTPVTNPPPLASSITTSARSV